MARIRGTPMIWQPGTKVVAIIGLDGVTVYCTVVMHLKADALVVIASKDTGLLYATAAWKVNEWTL